MYYFICEDIERTSETVSGIKRAAKRARHLLSQGAQWVIYKQEKIDGPTVDLASGVVGENNSK